MNSSLYSSGARLKQSGVALVVVLLLLLVVTLLGLAAMRGTLLQERMAGNSVARSESFQAAEAALREAEAYAISKPSLPTAGCANGTCARPAAGQSPAWQTAGFWDAAGGYRLTQNPVNGVRAKYVVEDFGTGESSTCTASIDMSAAPCAIETQIYRVVVNARAPNGANVVLQSTFEVP